VADAGCQKICFGLRFSETEGNINPQTTIEVFNIHTKKEIPTMKSFGSVGLLQALFVLLTSPSLNADTTTYTGTTTLGCTDGTCTLGGACNDTVVAIMPGMTEDNVTFTEITGEVVIYPETCTAECEGCISTGADVDECTGSAGFVYCPERDECIRPWEENCPFEGDRFVGPVELNCVEDSRCNDLTEACSIAIGSATVGGPYLSGLAEGVYELPKGCLATCEGCTCVDEDNCEIMSPSGGVSRRIMLGSSAPLWGVALVLSWIGMR
jgi:hypothetical protein